MRLARHVLIKRNDARSALQCVAEVIQRLNEGSSVVIFAEGTRSPDGRLGR